MQEARMPTIEEARAWSPAHDPVHGFDHILRVVRMAERLADGGGGARGGVRGAGGPPLGGRGGAPPPGGRGPRPPPPPADHSSNRARRRPTNRTAPTMST